MKKYFSLRNFVIFAVACLIMLSAVSIGINEKTAVTVTETNAKAGKEPIINTAANPASDFTYDVVDNSSITITGYVGSSSQVEIPDTIDGKPVNRLADSAFANTSEISSICIPASVKHIAENAFSRCDGLLEFNVSGDNAFFSSQDGVLYNKDKTTLVAFPGGVAGTFTVPETVTKIDHYAFYYCYELTNVNMYNNITSIGDYAFSYCWNLKSISLSYTLTTLGKEALSYNLHLTSIYLPKSITSIGENALLGAQSSSGDYEYNFIDGIYCVKGSYAYNYVLSLGLTPIASADFWYDVDSDVYISTIFEPETSIYADALTEGQDYDEAANLVSGDNFYDFRVYDIGAKLNGGDISLTEDAFIYIPSGKYPNILRAYRVDDGELTEMDSEIVSFFSNGKKYIKITSDALGTFIVAEYFEITKGDADGDGLITVTDARLTLRAALEIVTLHPSQLEAVDLNKNGIADITEARKILRVAAEIDSFD